MVKFSIRVRSGAARFDVAVLADSADQAVGLVRERYRTSDVRVRSMTGPAARTEGFLRPDALAA